MRTICCLGLDAGLEGEEGDESNQYASGDKPNLDLPGLQEKILETVVASGKPTVLVLLSGSALAINWPAEHVPAILYGGYPGAQGGKAIAKLLFGDASPEGKLPITFYHSIEELPEFTDYSMKGRTYRYMDTEALYPFGFGLSYTDFELSNIRLSGKDITEAGIEIETDITNTGTCDGAETVQIYVKVDRPNTPNPQLKALKKVFLHTGETRHVVLKLSQKDFAVFNEEGKKVVSKGSSKVYVGISQPDTRSIALMGKSPAVFEVVSSYNSVVE